MGSTRHTACVAVETSPPPEGVKQTFTSFKLIAISCALSVTVFGVKAATVREVHVASARDGAAGANEWVGASTRATDRGANADFIRTWKIRLPLPCRLAR